MRNLFDIQLDLDGKYKSDSSDSEFHENHEKQTEERPSSMLPSQEELRQELVRENAWLHRWHMEYDSPPEGWSLRTRISREFYERERHYRLSFDLDGCVLGADGPCLLPAGCFHCL
jgi:hypothetical protein